MEPFGKHHGGDIREPEVVHGSEASTAERRWRSAAEGKPTLPKR